MLLKYIKKISRGVKIILIKLYRQKLNIRTFILIQNIKTKNKIRQVASIQKNKIKNTQP